MVTEVTVFQTANGQTFATKEEAEQMELFDDLLKKFEEEIYYRDISAYHIVEWLFTNYDLREKLTSAPLPKPLNR